MWHLGFPNKLPQIQHYWARYVYNMVSDPFNAYRIDSNTHVGILDIPEQVPSESQ